MGTQGSLQRRTDTGTGSATAGKTRNKLDFHQQQTATQITLQRYCAFVSTQRRRGCTSNFMYLFTIKCIWKEPCRLLGNIMSHVLYPCPSCPLKKENWMASIEASREISHLNLGVALVLRWWSHHLPNPDTRFLRGMALSSTAWTRSLCRLTASRPPLHPTGDLRV